MRRLTATESEEQIALFQWVDAQSFAFPELTLLFHVPNGGHRHINVAKKLRAEGVRAGVPDLMLPVPRAGYHGLFIELKSQRRDARATDMQKWWLEQLADQGYLTTVCQGWVAATDYLVAYLKHPVAVVGSDHPAASAPSVSDD